MLHQRFLVGRSVWIEFGFIFIACVILTGELVFCEVTILRINNTAPKSIALSVATMNSSLCYWLLSILIMSLFNTSILPATEADKKIFMPFFIFFRCWFRLSTSALRVLFSSTFPKSMIGITASVTFTSVSTWFFLGRCSYTSLT